MEQEKKTYFENWADRYRHDLTTNIMPFWMEHGWDRKHGGVYTCVNRDGSLMDTTKSVWFQGRFAFVCAFAYNNVEKNPTWLEAAKSAIDFIEKYCFDSDGHMYFSVTADGKLAAHYENTVLITGGEPEILTVTEGL